MLRHLILCTFLYLVGSIGLNAQTYYVKAGATGDGSSWANASGDIQSLLSISTAGTQIWIAQGTYYPIQCNPCSHTQRDTPFEIPEDVSIYGGFNGTETTLSQRNVSANPTILSGDIDQDGNAWNNAYTILYTKNVSAATLIDGFEVTGAYADNGSYDIYLRINSGGGLYNDGSLNGGSSHPTIRNCNFSDHYGRGFGGAIMNYGGFGGSCSPEIYDCQFLNNEASNNGGAVFNSGVFDGQTATAFVNCSFENNTANNGGAIYNQASEGGSSAVTYNNCTFESNTSITWGGAIVEFGNRGTCLPTYDNCTFISNSSNLGGAILNDGSFDAGKCNPVYTQCTWLNNTSNLGGAAVYSQGPFNGESHPTFDHCTFTNNNTNASGAALYFNGQNGNSNPTISNSVFTDNKAGMYGGGMYNFGKSGHCNPKITNCMFIRNEGAAAGSIYNYGGVNGESSPIITNCTFFKNKADVGPCIYNQASDPTGTVRTVVSNCIFWENISTSGFGLVFQNGYAQPTISHSLFPLPDCTKLNTDVNSTVTCGAGLLFNTDPLFMNEAFEDLHLQENSPVRDYGDNVSINATGIIKDLDDANRVFNAVVDFGVYEYQSAYQAPAVIAQSASATHCEGEPESLYIVTSGTPPFTFQWKKNGNNINGETDSTLIFSALTLANVGDYTCVVTSSMADVDESDLIVLTVNPLLEVVLDIEASTTSICQGETITFTSNSTNEGNAPVYSWFVNGTGVGSNQNQLQLDNLSDGDLITCSLTSSELCTTGNLANSNSIEINVAEILAVDIEIQATKMTICANESINFEAITQHPGNTPSYTWFINSMPTPGNAQSIELDDLNDGDQITCVLQSSENCTTNNPAGSNVITIEVNPLLDAEITIAASTTSICEGEEITFQATTVNGGNNPEFSWYVNSTLMPGNSDQLVLNTLQNDDEVSCELLSSYVCPQQNPVSSNGILIEVQEFEEAAVSIESAGNTICEGGDLMMEAIPVNGGNTPEFIWLINGIPTGANTPLLTVSNPNNGDEIIVKLISSGNCIAEDTVSSVPLEIMVTAEVEVEVSIEADALTICQGEEVTITAVAQNGGPDVTYQWLLNGVDQNIDNAVFVSTALADGDILQCQLTSSLDCVVQNPVISNSLNFEVKSTIESSVNIEVTDTIVCIGDTLFFNSLSVNAGVDPIYQWLLNGTMDVGGNSPAILLSDLPVGIYNIHCVLTSSEDCLAKNPMSSNTLSFEIIDTEVCQVSGKELTAKNQFAIFPNPSHDGNFFLEVEGDFRDLDLMVRDIQGRLVFRDSGIDINQKAVIPISLNDQAKGLFFIHLVVHGKVSSFKVMIL